MILYLSNAIIALDKQRETDCLQICLVKLLLQSAFLTPSWSLSPQRSGPYSYSPGAHTWSKVHWTRIHMVLSAWPTISWANITKVCDDQSQLYALCSAWWPHSTLLQNNKLPSKKFCHFWSNTVELTAANSSCPITAWHWLSSVPSWRPYNSAQLMEHNFAYLLTDLGLQW